MGLMLSVLVMCVGVLEAISAVRHIRESYLPMEFKRKKRRMVVDLGTGTVRHVDISWPGDVPRGTHVIRRRSGLMSPHSSFDLPDDDTSRRTSVHFDPVLLERAMSDILLEEDTEEPEDTALTQPIVETRLEFATRPAEETASFNELRQETETLPGNRPSLSSRPDIVDLKTPAFRTDHPPKPSFAESDSLTSEKISFDKSIHPAKESSPQREFISIATLQRASSFSTNIPQSVSEIEILPNNVETLETSIDTAVTFRTVNRDNDETIINSLISTSPEESVQISPLVTPATSEKAASSLTEISGTVSTKRLSDKSTEKSDEGIPEDHSLNRVDRLESIERLIESTNDIIICQNNELIAKDIEVQAITDETKEDPATGNSKSSTASPSKDACVEPCVESALVPNDPEVNDLNNSVGSVVHALAKQNPPTDEFETLNDKPEPANLTSNVFPENPTTDSDDSHNVDVESPESLCESRATEPTDVVCEPQASVVQPRSEEPQLGRGLSHESTIFLDSVEESSATSTESQIVHSFPPLEESIVNYAIVKTADESKLIKDEPFRAIDNENDDSKDRVIDSVNDTNDYGSVTFGNSPRRSVEQDTANSFDIALIPTPIASISNDPGAQYVEPNNDISHTTNTLAVTSESVVATKELTEEDEHTWNDVPESNNILSESAFRYAPNNSLQRIDSNTSIRTEHEANETEQEVKRKSLIETENIVISTHQIESDENVSAQHATQSSLTQAATIVEDQEILQDPRVLSGVLMDDEANEDHVAGTDDVDEPEMLNAEVDQVLRKDDQRHTVDTQDSDKIEPISERHSTTISKSNEVKTRQSISSTEGLSKVVDAVHTDLVLDSPEAPVDIAPMTTAPTDESSLTSEASSDVQENVISAEPVLKVDQKQTVETQSVEVKKIEPILESGITTISKPNETTKTHQPSSTDGTAEMVDVFHGDEVLGSPIKTDPSTTAPTGESSLVSEASSDGKGNVISSKVEVANPFQKNDRIETVGTQDEEDEIEPISERVTTTKSIVTTKTQQSISSTNGTATKVDAVLQKKQTTSVESPPGMDSQPERDGPKSKSNDEPNLSDRSIASEVNQEMKSVSSIEDSSEVVKVAPSAPAAPQMEDIPVPSADTSPNKAFWVRE